MKERRRKGGRKDKVKVCFYIDRRVLEELKRLAFAKHGRFHGALSYEAEQALQSWAALHTQGAHTPPLSSVNPQPRAARVWEEVKAYLKRRFSYVAFMSGAQIPRAHLVEAIAAVRGSDRRTVRKWLDEFMKYGLVKWIGGEVFEVV